MRRRRAVDCDYDARPERLRLAREVLRRHAATADIHGKVAARFAAEGRLPVLDVGCGEGELAAHLPPGGWVGIDASQTMVAHAPDGAAVARADALPPSRHDSPELHFALPQRVLTFDAELAPELVAEHFADVEVEAWDQPWLTLPTSDDVRDYLIGKGTNPEHASVAARRVTTPLTVTKRGALLWGRAR